jgi:hypothetical protein
MDPISAISIGMGLFQGGMSMFSPKDYSAQASAAYQNELGIRQADIMNRQKERAAGRAKVATEEQIFENRDAASRAMAREQARMNEQLLGFSLGRQSLIRERILAQGQGNAVERYGRSARRIRDIDIVGEYGRQNALFSENVASAGRQFGRNMTDLARQRYDADRQAVGSLQAQLDGFMPVMAQTTYNPPTNNNAALGIGQGLMTGLQTGFSMDSMLRKK